MRNIGVFIAVLSGVLFVPLASAVKFASPVGYGLARWPRMESPSVT